MNKELVKRFWEDFQIPTQEETINVAFANPADVAKALIKARNWSATIAQELVKVQNRLAELEQKEEDILIDVNKVEKEILIRQFRYGKISTAVTKNKEIQHAYIRSMATNDEEQDLKAMEQALVETRKGLHVGNTYKEQVDTLRRTLEKTTDWLIQYINWHKFELRELT